MNNKKLINIKIAGFLMLVSIDLFCLTMAFEEFLIHTFHMDVFKSSIISALTIIPIILLITINKIKKVIYRISSPKLRKIPNFSFENTKSQEDIDFMFLNKNNKENL